MGKSSIGLDEELNKDPKNGTDGIDFKTVPRLVGSRAFWIVAGKMRVVVLVMV